MADHQHIIRRGVLKGVASLSAALAFPGMAGRLPSQVGDNPTLEPVRTATSEDLTRYYAFLWSEFSALSKEMGVDMHDSNTAHRNGDIAAIADRLTDSPSTRAILVLQTIGAA